VGAAWGVRRATDDIGWEMDNDRRRDGGDVGAKHPR
jgi:hypothetical protein